MRHLPPAWRRWELPTWTVAAAIYGGYAYFSYFSESLGPWSLLALACLVAWHGSLQHETIHGHPTRFSSVNRLLGGIPLGLLVPYGVYKSTHLAHHRTSDLTFPDADPESFYIAPDAWNSMGRLRRGIHRCNQTLVGRLVLGPAISAISFLCGEVRRVLGGDRSHLLAWALHIVPAIAVLAWVHWVCGIPAWKYVVFVVYPSMSLTLLRSFAEHSPAPARANRTATVEAHALWSLLFLNNNLHVVHHKRPHLPWFEYRKHYPRIAASHAGERFHGYWEVMRQYAFRPRRSPMHPGVEYNGVAPSIEPRGTLDVPRVRRADVRTSHG